MRQVLVRPFNIQSAIYLTQWSLFVVLFTALFPQAGLAKNNEIQLRNFAGEFDGQGFSNCTSACGIVETDEEGFRKFSNELSLVMARPLGSGANTLGQAGTSVQLIGTMSFVTGKDRDYWARATNTHTPDKTFYIGHLLIQKGLPYSLEVGGTASYMFDSNVFGVGGNLKWAFLEGYKYAPDMALRANGSTILGITNYRQASVGGDLTISKRFALGGVATITPWLGYQTYFSWSGTSPINVYPQDPRPPTFDTSAKCKGVTKNDKNKDCQTFSPVFVFNMEMKRSDRLFLGAHINFWILKLALESSYTITSNIFQASGALGVEF